MAGLFGRRGDDKEIARQNFIKQNLNKELSGAIKRLQKDHIGSDSAIRSGDTANQICNLLEAMFLHELKESYTSRTFWPFVSKFTHRDIADQIKQLPFITSEIGQCRAWIRMAVNDCLMDSYLGAMLRDMPNVKAYYKKGAFLRDSEQPQITQNYLQGLANFVFQLSYNSSVLNMWGSALLLLSGTPNPPRSDNLLPASTHPSSGPRLAPSSQPVSDMVASYHESEFSSALFKGSSDEASSVSSSGITQTIPLSNEYSSGEITDLIAKVHEEQDSIVIDLDTKYNDLHQKDNSDLANKEQDSFQHKNKESDYDALNPFLNDDAEEMLTPKVQNDNPYNQHDKSPDTSHDFLSQLQKPPSVPHVESQQSNKLQNTHDEDEESNDFPIYSSKHSHDAVVKSEEPSTFPIKQRKKQFRTVEPIEDKNLDKQSSVAAMKKTTLKEGNEKTEKDEKYDQFPRNNRQGNPQNDGWMEGDEERKQNEATEEDSTILQGNSLGNIQGWSSNFPSRVPSTVRAKKLPLIDQPSVAADTYDEFLQGYISKTKQVYRANSLFKSMDKGGEEQDKENTSPPSTDIGSSLEEDFEIIPNSATSCKYTDARTEELLERVTKLGLENGLDSQNYQCKGCSRPVGIIYGPAKVCNYDGCYYCKECHLDDEMVIPARILYNWDFRKHNVCRHTKIFLNQIEAMSVIDIKECNPSLYRAVPEMEQIQVLRTQLKYLRAYLFTCKQSVAEGLRKKVWPREYMLDRIDLYSVQDLLQVQNGTLAPFLRKVILFAVKHVQSCGLCSQKGFICEICNSEKIIYPFDMELTLRCEICHSVFHKTCKTDSKPCPRCLRRKVRHVDHVDSTTSSDTPFASPFT